MNLNNNVIHDSVRHHDHPNMNRNFINYAYAPVWKRFVAYFFDLVFISIFVYIFFLLIQMVTFFVGNLAWTEFVDRNWYFFVLGELIVIVWIYFTFLPSTSLFSTFGQFASGLKQIDKTGNKLTFARSNAKFFSSIFSKILYIGYFLVYFNDYRQTFHEMLTCTFLVER